MANAWAVAFGDGWGVSFGTAGADPVDPEPQRYGGWRDEEDIAKVLEHYEAIEAARREHAIVAHQPSPAPIQVRRPVARPVAPKQAPAIEVPQPIKISRPAAPSVEPSNPALVESLAAGGAAGVAPSIDFEPFTDLTDDDFILLLAAAED